MAVVIECSAGLPDPQVEDGSFYWSLMSVVTFC